MSNSLYTVSNLSFSYGNGTHVFDGLNLQIQEGLVTTLIGANGSGKTTLFNLLTKNLKPKAGAVLLRGVDIAELRLADFSKLVSIVHQQNSAPSDLTVQKLVEYGRYVHRKHGRHPSKKELRQRAQQGEQLPTHSQVVSDKRQLDEAAVQQAMDLTDIAELANQPISSLSGGQKQRVWLAVALAQGSKVLLLDEPTTYLDVRYQLDILNLVQQLHGQLGTTVLMVLHDMNQAAAYSDQVIALADGGVVAQGAPEDVLKPAIIEEVYGVRLDVIDVNGRPFVVNV